MNHLSTTMAKVTHRGRISGWTLATSGTIFPSYINGLLMPSDVVPRAIYDNYLKIR